MFDTGRPYLAQLIDSEGVTSALVAIAKVAEQRLLARIRAIPVEHLQRESVSYICEPDAEAIRTAILAALETDATRGEGEP